MWAWKSHCLYQENRLIIYENNCQLAALNIKTTETCLDSFVMQQTQSLNWIPSIRATKTKTHLHRSRWGVRRPRSRPSGSGWWCSHLVAAWYLADPGNIKLVKICQNDAKFPGVWETCRTKPHTHTKQTVTKRTWDKHRTDKSSDTTHQQILIIKTLLASSFFYKKKPTMRSDTHTHTHTSWFHKMLK